MSKPPSSSRLTLPTISASTPQLSYAQRYQHMTKLANYNQTSQNQIWKEYQKLRTCLKQINEEVLYHMERKAYSGLNKEKNRNQNVHKDSEGVLLVLEDEKRTNQLRYSNFYTELSKFQERINYLAAKPHYLEEMTLQIQQLQQKIKLTKKQTKDYKRKTKITGKNIVNCTSALDKLIFQQDRLHRATIRHRRFKQYFQTLSSKQQSYKQRISQTQQAISTRLHQFSSQSNFIQEQIHYEKYQQLKAKKQNLGKYEEVYKRNYLMKLRDLEGLVNSVVKYQRVIAETEESIHNVRGEVELVTQLVGKNPNTYKKRSNSSMMQMSMNTVRIRSKQNRARQLVNVSMDKSTLPASQKVINHSMNDKNQNV